MEDQFQVLSEQMEKLYKQINELKKRKDEDSQPKELRPPSNPATILTTEISFDAW